MKRKTTRKQHKKQQRSFLPHVIFTAALIIATILVLGNNYANPFNVLGLGSSTVESAPDEVIIKYKSNVDEKVKEKIRSSKNARVKEKIDKLRMEVVKVQKDKVKDAIEDFKKNPNVEYAEPNYISESVATTNDPDIGWGMYRVNAANKTALSAWNVTIGKPEIKIAILDTGIESTHSDLAGKVILERNFTASSTTSDLHGHGTHTSGIAAANTNNAEGVAGAGYNSVILNGKVMGDDGNGYYSWLISGLVWAADNGAQVINLSVGGTGDSLALRDAIDYAWGKGAVMAAAAGNNNTSTPFYPAFYENTIAVASIDYSGTRSMYSNYGSWVDVAAPGDNIKSTYKGNSYKFLSGTSMAAPHVAGIAALVWAKGDCTTNICVREKIEKTADAVTGSGSYWTWGLVNAYKAVKDAPPEVPENTMTVADIVLSYATKGGTKTVSTNISVADYYTAAALSKATIAVEITSPSGTVTKLQGSTNNSGQKSFSLRSTETGIFTATITGVTKQGYFYLPSITTKTLLVK